MKMVFAVLSAIFLGIAAGVAADEGALVPLVTGGIVSGFAALDCILDSRS